jgi:hypothetical protein
MINFDNFKKCCRRKILQISHLQKSVLINYHFQSAAHRGGTMADSWVVRSRTFSYVLVRSRTFSYETPSPLFQSSLILRHFRSYDSKPVRGASPQPDLRAKPHNFRPFCAYVRLRAVRCTCVRKNEKSIYPTILQSVFPSALRVSRSALGHPLFDIKTKSRWRQGNESGRARVPAVPFLQIFQLSIFPRWALVPAA